MLRRGILVGAIAALPLAGVHSAADARGTTWVSTGTRAAQVDSVVRAGKSSYVAPRYRAAAGRALQSGKTLDVYQPARDLGRISSGARMHIVVGLRLRDQSTLLKIIRAQATPGNPWFGHYLTPAQTRADFAPRSSQVQAVVSYLKQQGLTGVKVSANNLLVQAAGPSAAVERAFNTRIDQFDRVDESAGTVTRSRVFANTRPAQVPSQLGGVVASVLGLNNANAMHVVKPNLVLPTNLLDSYDAAGLRKAYDADGTENPNNCLTSSFGTPPVGYPQCEAPKTATANGQGTSVAIMAAGNLGNVVKDTPGGTNDGTDLSDYEAANNLPFEPVTIECTVPCNTITPGPTDADYQGEFDLDTQTSSGIAGGVKHLYVYDTPAPLLDAYIVQEFNLFQSQDLAKAGSASFGGCEQSSFLDGSMLQIDEALSMAAAQGQTMFASTGDTGGSCSIGIPNGVPAGAEGQVEYPASSPFVVGVGGTTLFTNNDNSYNHEIPWYAGGGGDSLFEYEPSWQQDVVPPLTTATCTVAYTTCFGKGLPDISMDADPNTGATVYLGGTTNTVGGTSLSSPLALGSWARLNSDFLNYLANHNNVTPPSKNFSGLPFAAPLLYSLYTPLSPGGVPALGTPAPQGANYPLHDIIDGTNTPYPAYPGWDYSTGLGTLDLAQVNYAIDHASSLVPPPLPTVPSPACTTASDPAGDEAILGSFQDPALDILAVGFRTTTNNPYNLVGQMKVSNLSSGIAGQPSSYGGDDWYITWTYNGVTDFLSAQYSPSNTPNPGGDPTDPNTFTTFGYGHVVPGTPNTYQQDGTAQGTLDLTNNLITVYAPLSGFTYQSSGGTPTTGGTPPTVGTVLSPTGGFTFALIGTGVSGGLLEQADSASGSSYTVGHTCSSSVTSAALSFASAQRHGQKVTFHWTLAPRTQALGFNLYAAGTRLNRSTIPVTSTRSYTFTTRWTAGPYRLTTILRNGHRLSTRIG